MGNMKATMTVKYSKVCPGCLGEGTIESTSFKMPANNITTIEDTTTILITCPVCEGSGYINVTECYQCTTYDQNHE